MPRSPAVTGSAFPLQPQIGDKSSKGNVHVTLTSHINRASDMVTQAAIQKFVLPRQPAGYKSHDAIQALQQHKLQTARQALITLGCGTTAIKMLISREAALALQRSKSDESTKNAIASKKEMKACLALDGEMVDIIANALREKGISRFYAHRTAKEAYRKAEVEVVNSRGWETVVNAFQIQGKTYQSTITPAGQMKLTGCGEAIFPTPYQGKGVGCIDSTNGSHAANLWHSHITAPGPDDKPVTIYKALRMATIVPYSIKDRVERERGALERGKEAILAALFTQPDKLQSALKGETVPLRLASIALMTQGLQVESTSIKEQFKAWEQLGQHSPLELQVRNHQGELQKIKVKVEIAALNYPVNELGLKLKMGLKQSDKINQQGLKLLLGSDLQPWSVTKGWVGEYLRTNPPDGEEVWQMAKELKQILTSKAHHSDGGEPYKVAMRINLLAQRVGAVAILNCRSGKDRTAMGTNESQAEAISRYQKLKPLPPDAPLDAAHRYNLHQALIHGGSHEIQIVNTGAGGNKVIQDLPFGSALNLCYKERLGDPNLWREVRGLTPIVKT